MKIQQLWTQIEQSLSAKGCLEQMGLRPGASEREIADLEAHLGVRFPDSLRMFLSIHDGQEGTIPRTVWFAHLVPGRLLPIAQIQRAWERWRELEYMNADCAPHMGSSPEGAVKLMYTHRAWIPLLDTAGGNYLGLDYDPDIGGTAGQVISFGPDEDLKCVLSSDFEGFVEKMAASIARSTWDGHNLRPDHPPGASFLHDFIGV